MVSSKLSKLKKLNDSPKAQSEEAVRLLKSSPKASVIDAALEVLKKHPLKSARPVLIEIYNKYQTKQIGSDRSGLARAKVLEALRPIMEQEDALLLEKAALTYEFTSKNRDEAQALRAIALILLNENNPVLAGYISVKLLDDKYTSEMSAEPAVTAARVLLEQGNILPLYFYLLNSRNPRPEVLTVYLDDLKDIPSSLLIDLLEKCQEIEDVHSLINIIELVIAKSDFDEIKLHLSQFLLNLKRQNIFRYVATILATSRKDTHTEFFLNYIFQEKDEGKLEILADILHETKPLIQAVSDLDSELLFKALQRLKDYG